MMETLNACASLRRPGRGVQERGDVESSRERDRSGPRLAVEGAVLPRYVPTERTKRFPSFFPSVALNLELRSRVISIFDPLCQLNATPPKTTLETLSQSNHIHRLFTFLPSNTYFCNAQSPYFVSSLTHFHIPPCINTVTTTKPPRAYLNSRYLYILRMRIVAVA